MTDNAQHPADRLAQIRDLTNRSNADVARRLAVHLGRDLSRATVSNIILKRYRPGRDVSLAIEAEFGIPATDWKDAPLAVHKEVA